MDIYWKDGKLVMELLGDVGKTEDGKFYLKKISLNNGETWICENDSGIDTQFLSFEAKGGTSIGKDEHMWYNKFNKKYLKEKKKMSEFKDINVGIAGFEMPKCCMDCVLYDHYTGCCAILDECIYNEEEEDNDFWVEKQRYYACPLREISFY